jgi:hypothetical protein
LALIGPYKAISAEGSFAIQVYRITSDESGKVVKGEMLWDGYTDNVEYDKFLTGDIRISTGTGRDTIAKVGYAVWSDAVEATVEVNILHSRSANVHGVITAHYGSSYGSDHRTVLFGRRPDESVELVPSAADHFWRRRDVVPLGRSVIAVPLLSRYSLVTISVDLDEVVGRISFYLDRHSGEIRIEQEGDIFLPMRWTRGFLPNIFRKARAFRKARVQVNMTSPGFHLSPLQPDNDWRRGAWNL